MTPEQRIDRLEKICERQEKYIGMLIEYFKIQTQVNKTNSEFLIGILEIIK